MMCSILARLQIAAFDLVKFWASRMICSGVSSSRVGPQELTSYQEQLNYRHTSAEIIVDEIKEVVSRIC